MVQIVKNATQYNLLTCPRKIIFQACQLNLLHLFSFQRMLLNVERCKIKSENFEWLFQIGVKTLPQLWVNRDWYVWLHKLGRHSKPKILQPELSPRHKRIFFANVSWTLIPSVAKGENNVKSRQSDKYKVSPAAFNFLKSRLKYLEISWKSWNMWKYPGKVCSDSRQGRENYTAKLDTFVLNRAPFC